MPTLSVRFAASLPISATARRMLIPLLLCLIPIGRTTLKAEVADELSPPPTKEKVIAT